MNTVKIGLACGAFLAASIALSPIHPWGNPRSGVGSDSGLLQGSNVPEDVRRVLEKKCGDCHSDKTHYPAYTRLSPVSWMIEHDIHEAPGFTLISILVIAVGIGVNTAVFSVINTVLLKPLTYPDPQSLFEMRNTSQQG